MNKRGDAIAEYNTLRKELDRKDERNNHLTKELLNFRTAYAQQQKELRFVGEYIENSKEDRQRLQAENATQKEHIRKLESKLSLLHNSCLIEQLQSKVKGLTTAIINYEAVVASKDTRIGELEKELEIINRSIDIQARYELQDSVSDGLPGREIMKSIYYELGKRETEMHELALELSRTNKDAEILERTTREQREEINNLRNKCDEKANAIASYIEEIARYKEDLLHNNDALMKATAQVAEISRRLEDTITVTGKELSVLSLQLEETKSQLSAKEKSVLSLQTDLDSLRVQLKEQTHLRNLIESKAQAEREGIEAERATLQAKLIHGEVISEHNELLRASLSDAILSRDNIMRECETVKIALESSRSELRTLEGQLRDLQSERATLDSQHTLRVESLERERDSILQALSQTMAATRDLSDKYKAEVEARLSAEKRLSIAEQMTEEQKRSKVYMSTAVLDALHRERQKAVSLEEELRRVNNNAVSGGGGGGTSVSTEVTPLRSLHHGAKSTPSSSELPQPPSSSSRLFSTLASLTPQLNTRGGTQSVPYTSSSAIASPHHYPTSTYAPDDPEREEQQRYSPEPQARTPRAVQLHPTSPPLPPLPSSSPSVHRQDDTRETGKTWGRYSSFLLERALDEFGDQDEAAEGEKKEQSLTDSVETVIATTEESAASISFQPSAPKSVNSVVEQLKKLNEELRTIEQAAPSPLSSSHTSSSVFHTASHSSFSASYDVSSQTSNSW